jgi:hypothetical protein
MECQEVMKPVRFRLTGRLEAVTFEEAVYAQLGFGFALRRGFDSISSRLDSDFESDLIPILIPA